MIIERADQSGFQIRIDPSLYSEAVVYKCFYWYGDRFDVVIERAVGGDFVVRLDSRLPELPPKDLLDITSRIKRDLVDFKTRDIIARETQAIRELLVAKAFSPSDEYDEAPIGSLADPSGLGPDTLANGSR